MREIKFRAWDSVGNCWLRSELIQDLIAVGIPDEPRNGIFTIHEYETKRFTIMQFTGLTDRQGVEIYEGDIIRYYNEVNQTYGHDDCEVLWNQARCYFELKAAHEYFGHLDISQQEDGRYEIMGNIYENPELLEH